jgi:hypothetical protein
MTKVLVLLAALILFGASASAQVPCNQRAEIVTELAGKYKEVPVAIGVNSKGHLVEVLSSEHGRTWTIIVTSPAGMSCVVSVGEDWSARQMEEQQAEPQV